MQAGDVIEFKSGLFGLEEPENVAIYLERVKRKSGFFVKLHTLRGRQEVKKENLGSTTYDARVDPTLPASEMHEELKAVAKRIRRGEVKAKVDPGDIDLTDRDLWERVANLGEEGPASPQEIASEYFDLQTPTGKHVAAVREVLKSCNRPGIGFFEREAGRGETWRILTVEQYHDAKARIQRVASLKNKLVQVHEEERDDGSIKRTYEGVPLSEAALTDEDREDLELMGNIMEEFLRYDEHRGEVRIPGTFVHTLDGSSLFQNAKWLAQDWTGHRGTISAAFAQFLLETELRSVDDLVNLIAERKVLQHEHFTWEVPPEAEREASRLDPPDADEGIAEGRTDLRHLDAWTIDPPDAKDFDDAVSFQEHDDGTATLWVHIADVSHYVPPDGFTDHHAETRATSVYLPVKVLPMLPPRLADDLCSLRDDADRYAISVRMTFDEDANVTDTAFHESVIRVNENLSYGEVNDAVEAGEEPFASMEAFARKLKTHRDGLDLETDERRIHLDEDGVDLELKSASPSTRMIEQFMVHANEAVARHLTEHDVPIPYRCHPLPERWKVERYNHQMEAMGLDASIEPPALPEDDEDEEEGESILDQLQQGGKMELTGGGGMITGLDIDEEDEEDGEGDLTGGAEPWMKGYAQLDPEEREAWIRPFQEALDNVVDMDDTDLRELVYIKTLQTLGRALYTPRNMGHFGLGSTCYGHFTSPIRRYPDLLVHRQLRWLLQGGNPEEGDPPYGVDELDTLTEHCTDQAVDAERLEWDVVDVAMAFLAREGRWSGTQRALVNGFSRGGVFVSLPGHLEARIAVEDIPGGPWSVDEHESMLFKGEQESPELAAEVTAENWRELVDEETGEVRVVAYTLGEEVPVHITGIDLVDGKIDVRPVGDGEAQDTGDPADEAEESDDADDAEGDDGSDATGDADTAHDADATNPGETTP